MLHLFPSQRVLTLLFASVTVFSTSSTQAQDYLIRVNGIVCEFCALGVSKKVSKLKFIDRAKYDKGVDVNVKAQLVTIAVKADAVLEVGALYAAIEAGGYNPVELWKLAEDGSRNPVPNPNE